MKELKHLEKELEEIKERYRLDEPERGDLDDKNIVWRYSKPNYVKANLEYLKGKTMNHSAESLERLVENLVKTWEMEASHKAEFTQWTTVDHNNYSIRANNGKVFKKLDAVENGNYNCLLDGCSKDLYDNQKETFESSHELFRDSFPDGFPWELIKVFTGPPKVTFTWRHWAKFSGKYKDNIGNSELIEMYGFAQVIVNDNLKIQNIEVFFDGDKFLNVMEGNCSYKELSNGKSLVGSCCPFINNINESKN